VYLADKGNHLVRKLSLASVYVGAVTNAASFLTGPVVPGEYVSIFGSGIGPSYVGDLGISRLRSGRRADLV